MTDAPGLYVYGIVGMEGSVPSGAVPVQPAAGDFAVIEHEGVAAVVSPIDGASVRMTRANLEAHQSAVEAIMGETTVLPMRFGIVADSATALVEQFLEPQHRRLLGLLQEFAGGVELRVEARFIEDVMIREAVAAVPKIRQLQARIAKAHPDAAYYERLALGELIAATVDRMKDSEAAKLGSRLAPLARRAQQLPAGDESVVCRGAFLVDRSATARFDAELSRIAASESRRLSFSLVGPLPPWDFVELQARVRVS
jgi:hypothetical protein